MSISTMRGDGGETSLAGGVRVSKASERVETYGTIDELISSLGFARSICEDADIAALTKSLQQDLFRTFQRALLSAIEGVLLALLSARIIKIIPSFLRYC